MQNFVNQCAERQALHNASHTCKDKANTFAFTDKASARLPSQTRRLVTRRFGIDERCFESLKGALRKDALRQITRQYIETKALSNVLRCQCIQSRSRWIAKPSKWCMRPRCGRMTMWVVCRTMAMWFRPGRQKP